MLATDRKKVRTVDTGTGDISIRRVSNRQRFEKPELCGEGVRMNRDKDLAELEGQRSSVLGLINGIRRAELESPRAEIVDTQHRPAELAAEPPHPHIKTNQGQQ